MTVAVEEIEKQEPKGNVASLGKYATDLVERSEKRRMSECRMIEIEEKLETKILEHLRKIEDNEQVEENLQLLERYAGVHNMLFSYGY